ncbi:MAG: hypothetical protein ACI92Z_001370 [Paracoccaceae bacterium]|jgi:hypothetical protein
MGLRPEHVLTGDAAASASFTATVTAQIVEPLGSDTLVLAVVAGQDLMAWINKYASRLIAAHIKDIAPKGEALDEDGWADPGHGTMDWLGIMQALRATPYQYFVMEHDNQNVHERFARRAIAAAKLM